MTPHPVVFSQQSLGLSIMVSLELAVSDTSIPRSQTKADKSCLCPFELEDPTDWTRQYLDRCWPRYCRSLASAGPITRDSGQVCG
jgi:hypothetical protein